MPTAGEATLKSKSFKKASNDGTSCKGKETGNEPSVSKIREGTFKKRTVSHSNSAKSSIPRPVPVKKEAKGKENADPAHNVDPGTKINKKASKVKQAPDFRKLHRKWNDQLSKGKAVSKKKNTTVEPFKLAANNQQSIKKVKRPYAYNSEDEEDNRSYEDDDDFQVDSTALKEILNNTGIKDEDLRMTGRATIAALSSSHSELAITQPSEGILKRTSIYYTGPPTQNAAGTSRSISKICSTPSTGQTTASPLKPRNVDIAPAARSQVASCARKQVAWADEVSENDAFDFQPDSQALQSILNNTGISFNQMSVQNTGRVTLADGRLTPYRKARQSFREESNKKTSIYYTGPRRTRPSPRACGMGRTSVLGASQLTASSAVNSQKPGAYDPLQTVVGRQGNQEQENEGMVGLGVRQFPPGQPEPGFKTAPTKPLLPPGRKLVSSVQPSPARDQPSWAEILTPQRSARVQESAAQATRLQPSLEPLRTPAKQQGPQEDICTPQRLLNGTQGAAISQGHIRSTFENSSSTCIQQPLIELKQQHSAFTVDLQPSDDTIATPARQLQIGSQAPRSDLPTECSHVHGASFQLPARTFATPVLQSSVVSRSLSSDQPPLWSAISTPQRVTRQNVAAQNKAAHSFDDSLVNPLKQSVPVTNNPCSTQYPPMADVFASQQCGDAIQDLGPRLGCSTVQITSFQPSVDTTQGSCSMDEFLTPQRKDGFRQEHFKLTTLEEEDDVSLLERQALEDLGLLKITDGSQKELAASCTEIQENSDVFSSPLFNTWTDSSRSARNQKRTLPSVATYQSAEGVLDPPRSLCNAASTSTNQQSSFEQYPSYSPAERFVLPTPSRESKTNYPNILHTSSFTPTERELMSSRDAPLIPFNSTSSFNHQELSGNNAPLVQKSGTCSTLRQTSSNPAPCIAPIPLKVSHRKATSRESRVTSASSTSPVETPALTSSVVPSKERDDRPVQVVSPTPKVHVYKHIPSDRSLSLRSAISLNPGGFSHRISTAPSSSRANAQFRWEPNVPEIIPGAFRPTTSVSRRLPNTLAQDALLDMEVSVYMRAGHDRVVTEGDRRHRPINPLAKVFSEGDSMHFLPICVHQSL